MFAHVEVLCEVNRGFGQHRLSTVLVMDLFYQQGMG